MGRNNAPARRHTENETVDVRDAVRSSESLGRIKHLDFDDWRAALRIDAKQRGSELVDSIVADSRDASPHGDEAREINWTSFAKRALSIVAEQGYAEDRSLFERFSRCCEARGLAPSPHELLAIARNVADGHSRAVLDEGAFSSDFDGTFHELVADALDSIAHRGTLDERCSAIERELVSGTDLWWPERSMLVISYWQHPSPTIEVFRVGREAMLDALPRAMADARESGDDRVRLFDVSDHAGTNRHLETVSTPDSLHALALNLGQLDGLVIRGSIGTLDECQRAVDECDLSLLPSVLEAGEPLLHGGDDGVRGEGNPNPPLRPSHDGSHRESSFRSTPSYGEREC